MLRKLEVKDAAYMLEWMHDEEVLEGLQADVFRSKTIGDCVRFIKNSIKDAKNCHMAIVDEKDDYLGTVSLKNIDYGYGDAEFAIVLRKEAQGKGYARQALIDIMNIAFDDLQLEEVYWNVLVNNERAIRLYVKCGCQKMDEVPWHFRKNAPQDRNILFFHQLRSEWKNF